MDAEETTPEAETDDAMPGRPEYPDGMLLTADQAAEVLGVTARSVRRAFSENRLPYVRVARRGRFVRAEDVRAYAEGRAFGRGRPWPDNSETVDSTGDGTPSSALALLQRSLDDFADRITSAHNETSAALRELAEQTGRAERAEAELEAVRAELERVRRPIWRRLFG